MVSLAKGRNGEERRSLGGQHLFPGNLNWDTETEGITWQPRLLCLGSCEVFVQEDEQPVCGESGTQQVYGENGRGPCP